MFSFLAQRQIRGLLERGTDGMKRSVLWNSIIDLRLKGGYFMANSIREIMTTDIECVTLKDNVYEVACKMRDHNVGVIPVVDESQNCIGVITDRDIVIRGLAEKHEGSTAVEKVMSSELVTGTPDLSVDEAAKMMAQKQIRRLPVVENGKLVGIVAMADLAVRNNFADEAGYALSEISEPTGQHTQGIQ